MKTYKAEMGALNAALTAFMTRPADPVPPPILPDVDTLVDIIRPPIITSMRQEIAPLLRNLRTEVEGMLDKHTRQISTSLMSKLKRVLQTEQYIQEWLERESNNQVDGQGNGKPVTGVAVNGLNGTSHTRSDGHSPTIGETVNVISDSTAQANLNGAVAAAPS